MVDLPGQERALARGYLSLGLTDHGKRDRRHVTAKTRPEVLVKLRALQAQRDAGEQDIEKPAALISTPERSRSTGTVRFRGSKFSTGVTGNMWVMCATNVEEGSM